MSRSEKVFWVGLASWVGLMLCASGLAIYQVARSPRIVEVPPKDITTVYCTAYQEYYSFDAKEIKCTKFKLEKGE